VFSLRTWQLHFKYFLSAILPNNHHISKTSLISLRCSSETQGSKIITSWDLWQYLYTIFFSPICANGFALRSFFKHPNRTSSLCEIRPSSTYTDRYVNLLYYKQRSLLHFSTTYCGHLQWGVLWRIYYIIFHTMNHQCMVMYHLELLRLTKTTCLFLRGRHITILRL
jgi:hypothetical protein